MRIVEQIDASSTQVATIRLVRYDGGNWRTKRDERVLDRKLLQLPHVRPVPHNF